jgi:hypothetical protein
MTGQHARPARDGHEARDGRPGRFSGRLAIAATLGVLAPMMPVMPAAATTAGAVSAPGPVGNGKFGLTPLPGSDGHAVPYFTMTVAAGQSATGTAIISNLSTATEKLKVSRSTGVTAANGGSAFSHSFQRCSGPGCWVAGLPAVVTLPAGTREELLFTVHVPRGTPPSQYLAGITAELAVRPKPTGVGSNGRATARAVIIEQVTVGVAVTVGVLSRLVTRLQIPGVFGSAVGPTARLNIDLANAGQTFAHGVGQASCRAAAQRHSWTVNAATVLVHDQAVIAVNAPGLPEGATAPCQVLIHYGPGLTASWAGMVTVPAPPRTRTYHTGPGAYSVVPPSGIPAWAIALFVLGALVLAVLAVLLRRSRSRRRPANTPLPSSAPAPQTHLWAVSVVRAGPDVTMLTT